VSDLLRVGLVDPCGDRQLGWDGRSADEPLGILLVGGLEDAGAVGVELLRLAVVDGGWRHQSDPGVPVPVVVPVEEHERKEASEGPAIGLTLALAADVHGFLVSAALYWATLREVVQRVTHPDLRPLLGQFESAASTAKTAREHIEHLNERIAHGRLPKYGAAMPVEVFRQATGTFDGTLLRFGNESFSLDEMIRAIEESAAVIAPPVREALTPQLEVRVDPA
jgi:hypothetical protein